MFQPSATERHSSFESDPLLVFFSEQASARGPVAPSGVAIPEKPQQFAQPVESSNGSSLSHPAATSPQIFCTGSNVAFATGSRRTASGR